MSFTSNIILGNDTYLCFNSLSNPPSGASFRSRVARKRTSIDGWQLNRPVIRQKWDCHYFDCCPDNKVRGANMGPTLVLSAPDGPHVGPINLAVRVALKWCLLLTCELNVVPLGNIITNYTSFRSRNLHYSDVIMTRWCLKSPASRLFVQPFIRAQIKENIKAPRHWPLCGEFTGHRWIPHTKGQWRGKYFHLMTSP